VETNNDRPDSGTEQNQSIDSTGHRTTDEIQGTYRKLGFEGFPAHGHMLVVSPEWNAVYWLADRHAVIRANAVELDGPGQRLLEARANDRGVITFERVREHDVTRVTDGTPAARAADQLTDPWQIERTLYPPYIPDANARPARAYLRPPTSLTYGDAVALGRERREIYWLRIDHNRLENSEVFAAPLVGDGPVHWGMTYVSTRHPEWVLPALIEAA
jgi:hypothetical protein